MTKKQKIAVLKGGFSPEREVSLVSGQAVAKALRRLGHEAVEIDVTRQLWQQLEDVRPDLVFNALHGVWGEDGRVQGVLDMFGLPYTHSGVMASALAMDKNRAKAVLQSGGIRVPEGELVTLSDLVKPLPLPVPYVVKPNAQGSSVGVYLITEPDQKLPNDICSNVDMGEHVLVEKFIPGRELTVSVIGGQALCVTEIIAAQGFYDYKCKYNEGQARHVLPADIPHALSNLCLQWAVRAHQLLGCEGVSRVDYRFDDTGLGALENVNQKVLNQRLFVLEVNTQPGMTPLSLLPEQALHLGMDFDALCAGIIAHPVRAC